jgi:hypothetical protein
MFTIYDIIDNKKKRESKKLEMFSHILENCCKVIKKCDEIRVTHCVFEVPEYIFGYPLYNLNDCIVYLLQELTKGGFKVQYIFPNTLIISWHIPTKAIAPPPPPATLTYGKKSTVKKNGKIAISLS